MPTPDASQFIQQTRFRAVLATESDPTKRVSYTYNYAVAPTATPLSTFLPSFTNKFVHPKTPFSLWSKKAKPTVPPS
jgi:hypothetical protein